MGKRGRVRAESPGNEDGEKYGRRSPRQQPLATTEQIPGSQKRDGSQHGESVWKAGIAFRPWLVCSRLHYFRFPAVSFPFGRFSVNDNSGRSGGHVGRGGPRFRMEKPVNKI